MYSILYLPEAAYVREVYGQKAVSKYLTWHEANVEIYEILNTVKFSPNMSHIKYYHFEIVTAPDV